MAEMWQPVQRVRLSGKISPRTMFGPPSERLRKRKAAIRPRMNAITLKTNIATVNFLSLVLRTAPNFTLPPRGRTTFFLTSQMIR